MWENRTEREGEKFVSADDWADDRKRENQGDECMGRLVDGLVWLAWAPILAEKRNKGGGGGAATLRRGINGRIGSWVIG
jgi:hypothetical protein